MSEDRELAAWKSEWERATPRAPNLGDWMRRARRRFLWQNVTAVILTFAVAAFYIGYAWWNPEPDRLFLLAGAGVLFVALGGYTVRNARGTWRAESNTTRAFLELCERRARAKLRANRAGRVLAWIWLLVVVPPALAWKLRHVEVNAPFLVGFACGSVPLLVLAFWKMRTQRRDALRELDEAGRHLRSLDERA